MARIALVVAPLALLLTNACSITLQGGAPASPENVAWTPPMQPAGPVVVPRVVYQPVPVQTTPPAARDDGRTVIVRRAPAPSSPDHGTAVRTPALTNRLDALAAARHRAVDQRALAQADVRALAAERDANRRNQQQLAAALNRH